MATERYKYSLADLGSVLTGALSQSAAPSEFRALDWVDTLDWTVDDLVQIMSPRGISIEPIEWASIRENARALALRETVYLALSDDSAWVMSFDEETSRLRGISPDPSAVLPNNSVDALFRGSRENWKFFKCNRQSVENLAIFPGIETQWFWSTIWKNRGLYAQSALASFLTNFFALGTSLFSMIVYNRIIPSNALESLTVLVTGMMLLMVVDYAVRSIRNHFLSVAGIDSDLALADRLFAHMPPGVRVENLYRLTDGSYTINDPGYGRSTRAYLGGHNIFLDDTEVAELTAAGYGAYIS